MSETTHLLKVWRILSRSDLPQVTLEGWAELFRGTRGFDRLALQIVDVNKRVLISLAETPSVRDQQSGHPLTPLSKQQTVALTEAELDLVLRTAESGQLLKSVCYRFNRLPLETSAATSVANASALHSTLQQGVIGSLVWIYHPDFTPDQQQFSFIQSLRDPLDSLVQGYLRSLELASLQQFVEREKPDLLRKLGRDTVDDAIVGEHSGLRNVMERVNLVAPSDVPVMVLGETGTGKEVIARAIHMRSSRRAGPFIRVNCGAIPRELIDSQLFGHDRGSFTGASQARHGWFERANNGTLFLDEIGELPLDAQVRFLRVLQDGLVERVGGDKSITVNVRVVAATHRDLSEMVRLGRFREDLWYRLAVFPLFLPPLRERSDDICDLANHFLGRSTSRFGYQVPSLTTFDIELLQQYNWPGNIRELGAVIDRAVILGNGKKLEIRQAIGFNQQVPSEIEKPFIPAGRFDSRGSTSTESLTEKISEKFYSLDDAIRQHIIRALELTGGQIEGRDGAAKLLKINPHTLRARMRKLGIEWSSFRKTHASE